ncbi:MAG: PhnA domain-containing protein [Desulfuromonadales bacterium]
MSTFSSLPLHNIDCNIPGIGPMGLKSEFVKKS